VFRWTCENAGFQVVVELGDRHGSWVWEGVKSNNLNRYVTLSVTSLPKGALYESWAVADNGQRFKRVGVTPARGLRADGIARTEVLQAQVQMAIRLVSQITEADLEESYAIQENPAFAPPQASGTP
jgi:hypothetical protein